MPDNFSDILHLNPNQITINRLGRQRKEIDVSDLLDSISRNGIINPIIIRETNNQKYELIAGERRLECCKQLNIQVPCRLFSSLDPIEAKILELEENRKRKDLTWKEDINAIGTIHDLYLSKDPTWTQIQTAQSLSISEPELSKILYVFSHRHEEIVSYAENLSQAVSLLYKFKSEKKEKLENNLKQIISSKPIPDHLKPLPKEEKRIENLNFFETGKEEEEKSLPVQNIDFLDWLKDYSGPKFNLIHLDFPQGEEPFWRLLNLFIGNYKRIILPQAHILLWFQIENYIKIINSLSYFEINIIPQPFIWYKSDTKPNQITNQPPKNTYETCLIINHNSRPFKKQIQNIYATPRASQPICPNQKSTPMLKYLLSAFVDENTNVLDPTCGSGSVLLAAEELRSKSILGLEISPELTQKANEKITKSRQIRKLLTK